MIAITRKHKIFAVALCASVALYALIGFYLLPFVVLSKFPVILAEKTGQPAKLQAFKFNPFSFELEMEGFSISGSDGKNLFGFNALSVNFNAFASLSQQAVVFDSIVLGKPITDIKRGADGRFNFSNMLPKEKEKASTPEDKKSSSLPLVIRQLSIQEGETSWLDTSSGQSQSETLQPINLSIADLTIEKAGKAAFDLTLGLSSGGRLHWQGELGLTPISSKGRINLEDINLSKIWEQFLQKVLPVQISDGSLTFKTEYQASTANNGLAVTVTNGEVNIKQLAITKKLRIQR